MNGVGRAYWHLDRISHRPLRKGMKPFVKSKKLGKFTYAHVDLCRCEYETSAFRYLYFLSGNMVWTPFQIWWLFKFTGSQHKDLSMVKVPGYDDVSPWRLPCTEASALTHWIRVGVTKWRFCAGISLCLMHSANQDKGSFFLHWFESHANIMYFIIGPLRTFLFYALGFPVPLWFSCKGSG